MSFTTEPLLGRPTFPCLLTDSPRTTALEDLVELDSVGNLLLNSVNAFLASQTLDKEGRTVLD